MLAATGYYAAVIMKSKPSDRNASIENGGKREGKVVKGLEKR
jgi:hypothetical protein